MDDGAGAWPAADRQAVGGDPGPAVVQLTTREIYRNPWLSLREDTIRLPDGSTGIYGVIDKREFAMVIPYDRGGFHLVEQYRYPVQDRRWEFPQGGWPPEHPGGTPEELARAELAEETGYRAARWRDLGWLQAAPGVMSQGFNVFLATELTPGETARESTEQDMRQTWVPAAEFARMVREHEIVDAHTLSAYALFMLSGVADVGT